jgi:Protein of unknown function (DUF1573)
MKAESMRAGRNSLRLVLSLLLCTTTIASSRCDREPPEPMASPESNSDTGAVRENELVIGGDPEYRGVFGEGNQVSRTLGIQNNGQQTMRLKVLASSCGCVSAVLSPREIAPGESATLTLSANAVAGQRHPLVQHWTRLGAFPIGATEPALIEHVPFSFRIARDWRVNPGVLYAIARVGDQLDLETFIASTSSQAIEDVELHGCTIPGLSASAERIAPSLWRLAVSGKVTEIGEVRGLVRIGIKNPQVAKVGIPVVIYGTGRVSFEPPAVIFGPSTAGQGRTTRVHLKGADGLQLTAEAQPPVEGLRARVADDGFLEVAFDGAPNSNYGGLIEVRSSAGKPIGRLPVSVMAPRKRLDP